MGNGSPALHFQLAGAAVLLAGFTLAFAAPARAETPLPDAATGALTSAPVSAVAVSAVAATAAVTAAPAVDAVTATVSPPLEAAKPVVAATTTTAENVAGHVAASSVAPSLPIAAHAPVVARLARPGVSQPAAVQPAAVRSVPPAHPTFAPRHAARRPDRRPAGQRGAIVSANAVAAALSLIPSGVVTASRRVQQHRVRQSSVRPATGAKNTPIPGRTGDANAGAGLGAAPGGGSPQRVAGAPRAFALAKHDALFRVPVSTARPRSYRFFLELERPG
jgi:hypothetical protein